MDINLLRSFTILKQNCSLVNTEIYSSRAMKEGSCQWNSTLFEYATSTKLISSTVSYVVAETLGNLTEKNLIHKPRALSRWIQERDRACWILTRGGEYKREAVNRRNEGREKNLRTLFFPADERERSENQWWEKREERRKGKSLIEATSNRSASQLSKGMERLK